MAGKKKATAAPKTKTPREKKPRPSQTPVAARTPAPAPSPVLATPPIEVPVVSQVTPAVAELLGVPTQAAGAISAESAGLLPDISFIMTPYEHKPKDLPDHTSIDGLCGNDEFEKAVLRHKQLSIIKAAIEEEQKRLKPILIANMAVANRDDVAVGRFQLVIVHKGQPTIKKELLLQNGVPVDVIEKSTVVTPVEYPLITDMGAPKKARGKSKAEATADQEMASSYE